MYPDQVNLPNLKRLIEEFIHEQHHPGSNACDIPNLPHFYERITIHTAAVATFHVPSDLSGIGGMRCERIHAVDRWRNGPGCYDTLFINITEDGADDSDLSAHGFLGLNVAHAHLFFSFNLDGVKYPCVLVQWFSHLTDTPSEVTGMYIVEPKCVNGEPVTAVVHLDTVFRAAHLLPVFSNGPPLRRHWWHEQTLDLFNKFFVNQYIDYHAFEVVT